MGKSVEEGFVKQLTVFLENRVGTLQELTDILRENNINIFSLSLADTSEYGLLRMIVEEPDKARDVLLEAGFSAKTTDVVAVKLENKPGTLSRLVNDIAAKGIGIEYLYAMASSANGAIILRVSDNAGTLELLNSRGYTLLNSETMFCIDRG